MRVVRQYGTMWARNDANIARIPSARNGGRGVYVLFDGSMPMYVGKGDIRDRILGASTKQETRRTVGSLQLVCHQKCRNDT